MSYTARLCAASYFESSRMAPVRFVHDRDLVKKLLWLLAVCVFLVSMIGATVIARPVERGVAPTPFDSFGTVTVYRL